MRYAIIIFVSTLLLWITPIIGMRNVPEYGQTSVDNAAAGGSTSYVRDENGQTPLHIAAANENPDLVGYGADVSFFRGKQNVPENGQTNVHVAAAGDNVDTVQNEYGQTLLHIAAGSRTASEVGALVDKGFNVNAKDKNDRTPLHFAARNKSSFVASNLTSKGANVNAKDKNDQTPLHFAAGNENNPSIATHLVFKGADVNARDNEGKTPLHIAAANEDPIIAINLVADGTNGADVNLRDENDQTPLHIAAANKKCSLIALKLVSKGADVNARDKNGQTPLHIAAANENTQIAINLVENGTKGADVNAEDKIYRTPLDVAVANGCAFTVKYLVTKRAKANFEGPKKIQKLVKKANEKKVTVTGEMSKLLTKAKNGVSNISVSLENSGEIGKAKLVKKTKKVWSNIRASLEK